MRLHNWAFDDPSVFERVYGDLVEETGAVIMGRRSYDNSIEELGRQGPAGRGPVLRRHAQAAREADPIFTVVTDGIESALEKAREAAGEKRIGLMGADSISSSSPPASWTRSGSTWSTSCWEAAGGCSTSSRSESSWN